MPTRSLQSRWKTSTRCSILPTSSASLATSWTTALAIATAKQCYRRILPASALQYYHCSLRPAPKRHLMMLKATISEVKDYLTDLFIRLKSVKRDGLVCPSLLERAEALNGLLYTSLIEPCTPCVNIGTTVSLKQHANAKEPENITLHLQQFINWITIIFSPLIAMCFFILTENMKRMYFKIDLHKFIIGNCVPIEFKEIHDNELAYADWSFCRTIMYSSNWHGFSI